MPSPNNPLILELKGLSKHKTSRHLLRSWRSNYEFKKKPELRRLMADAQLYKMPWYGYAINPANQ